MLSLLLPLSKRRAQRNCGEEYSLVSANLQSAGTVIRGFVFPWMLRTSNACWEHGWKPQAREVVLCSVLGLPTHNLGDLGPLDFHQDKPLVCPSPARSLITRGGERQPTWAADAPALPREHGSLIRPICLYKHAAKGSGKLSPHL